MSSTFSRARGTPCSYCGVPVLHPNQQCCLNCKNHPFDILESDSTPRLKNHPFDILEPDSTPRFKSVNYLEAPTPPISPTTPSHPVFGTAEKPLAFEIRNIHNGTFVRIDAEDLKEEALWRHYDAGLVFEVEPYTEEQLRSSSIQSSENQLQSLSIPDAGPKKSFASITANHAVGIKINGTAFGKTCLQEGDQYIVDRDDENMAGAVVIYNDITPSLGERAEYSISEDSLDYTRLLITSDTKAWYDEEDGHPTAWLFHERTLYRIETEEGDEAESDFDFENERLHGVVFGQETEGQYVGPDNLYDDRLLVECEGTEFSIKRENVIVEVEVNENAYAQKLRENYSDKEQFWFQFGDKVVFVRDDEFDNGRVIVRYEDEDFSIARKDVDI